MRARSNQKDRCQSILVFAQRVRIPKQTSGSITTMYPNLIETEPVAQFINGSNVFSYFNINKVRIEGAEANITIASIQL
ncbi:MAG: hypothetical protein IPG82_19535 [Saprospiraceae bacterium]|nr:hypothetical protein [Saprospiraceae bacterium]